jgi:hypothetical protein
MNIRLMAKWISRLHDCEEGFWANIIQGKYLLSKDLFVDS